MSTLQSEETIFAPTEGTLLRFELGDRVNCIVGDPVDGAWELGTIKKVHFRMDSWPEGKFAPYQVCATHVASSAFLTEPRLLFR